MTASQYKKPKDKIQETRNFILGVIEFLDSVKFCVCENGRQNAVRECQRTAS